MKYLCLAYEAEETFTSMSRLEWDALNEAIQVASKWPSARFGTIEVRPVEEELGLDGRYS
jgi:hypothetical protein